MGTLPLRRQERGAGCRVEVCVSVCVVVVGGDEDALRSLIFPNDDPALILDTEDK